MAGFLDNCDFNATSTGTGDFVVTTALPGRQTPALAGATNAEPYKYYSRSADLSQWEIGEGAYTVSGTTLARTTVISNSAGTGTAAGQSGAGTKISFSTVPLVAIVGLKEDLISIQEANSFTAAQRARAQTNIGLAVPRGHVWGLTLSNDATTPNTVLDIAAGESASTSSPALLMSAAAFTKNCNAAWAVGSGNGALDSGSTLAASTWYHVFQILRSDTFVVDYLVSTNATAPAMPTSYDNKRRIGSFKTDASLHILAFKQVDDDFYWTAPVNDTTIPGTTDTLYTLPAVPTGVRVQPFLHLNPLLSSTAEMSLHIRSPDLQPSEVAGSSGGNASSMTFGLATNVTRIIGTVNEPIYTNTSAQVDILVSVTPVAFLMRTVGYRDTRGRLS